MDQPVEQAIDMFVQPVAQLSQGTEREEGDREEAEDPTVDVREVAGKEARLV